MKARQKPIFRQHLEPEQRSEQVTCVLITHELSEFVSVNGSWIAPAYEFQGYNISIDAQNISIAM